MSEPTIEIPVRLALLTSRYLSAVSGVYGENGKLFVDSIVRDMVNAIANQCTMEEIKIAAVAAEIQERL